MNTNSTLGLGLNVLQLYPRHRGSPRLRRETGVPWLAEWSGSGLWGDARRLLHASSRNQDHEFTRIVDRSSHHATRHGSRFSLTRTALRSSHDASAPPPARANASGWAAAGVRRPGAGPRARGGRAGRSRASGGRRRRGRRCRSTLPPLRSGPPARTRQQPRMLHASQGPQHAYARTVHSC